ncbi:hypothetical protein G6F65_021764 [Rhizopus arrhizus]|nr:hypothetical protein G6F65_021764 [Rhizopus arrhizus]
MVLERGQYRNADQQRPPMQHPAPGAVQVLRELHPQHDQQHDVQRRRLVERLVEAQQHIEQPAEHTADLRPFEAETQRPQQETRHRDNLRAEQPQRVPVQFQPLPAQEERDRIEQIDRPANAITGSAAWRLAIQLAKP